MRIYGHGKALFLLGLLVTLIGCRDGASTIAVIPRTTATLLWEPLHLGSVEAAHRFGTHIYWNAPQSEGDLDKQLAELDACIKDHYDGIIFAPDQTVASKSLVLEAMNRHTAVVIVDDELGLPAGPLLSYVSSDEAQGARMAAQRLASILGGHGTVAIIGMDTQSEGGTTREEELEKALARIAPSVQIVERTFGDAIVTHQQQVAEEVVDSRKVNAIVAMTAAATRGAYYARLAHGPSAKVAILGFDQDLLIPIRTGGVDAVIAQDTRRIGQIAVENVEAQRRGRQVAPVTLVAPLLLTRETIDSQQVSRLLSFQDHPWSQQ